MKAIRPLAAAGLVAALLAAPAASAQTRVVAGQLTCNVAPGTSFVFGSTREVNCVFTPTEGPAERYIGSIKRYGADLGFTNQATMIWAVVSVQNKVPPGGLAGGYGGVAAAVTPGAGGAANVLVGSSNRNVSLQPVSVEGNTGLNIALGVAELELRRP